MKYLFIFALVFLVNPIWSNSLEVCPECEISSIQSAIEQASNCDTIYIKAGTYKERDLVIRKSLYFFGIDNPIIDGESSGTVFTFNCDHFALRGLTITNVGHSFTKDFAGILVHRSHHFEISHITIEKAYFGILLEKSSHGEILNNHISSEGLDEASSGNGVHAWHCSSLDIMGNTVHNLRDGIYFEFVDDTEIADNISFNNIRYGLHFMFSNNNVYHHNYFENNGSGVAVMFSKFVEMKDNVFHQNWGAASYGLLLKEMYDAEIEGNVFSENTSAIHVEGSTRINYSNNHFKSNGWAIKMAGACYENVFENNNFMQNSFDISLSSNLNDNTFNSNYWGEYSGYDLDKDGIGDVPYRPVKLFSFIVNRTPEGIVLLRSLFVDIINFSEKVSPIFTPENLVDETPLMKPV